MGHTSTLLPDGQILFDGGAIGSPYWRHCIGCMMESELFDPSTGKIEKVGGPRPSRKYHSATLMADGRVLLVGGWTGRGDLKSAEIFDPATRKFLPVGEISVGSSRHSAHLLKDGRVFVFGGQNLAELFDPDTLSFSTIPTRRGSVNYVRALMVDDDRLFFAGGFTFSAGTLTPDGRIDFLNLARPGWGMEDHSITLLQDGSVLIAGGNEEMGGWNYQFSYNTNRTDLIDPLNRTSRQGPNMMEARSHHSATMLVDGRVLISGGVGGDEYPQASTEFFDSVSGRFLTAPKMASARSEHSATLLRDGRVLVVGGFARDFVFSAEMFVPNELPVALEVLSVDGQGAVLHAGTSRFVDAADPATAGDVVEIYARGLFFGKLAPKVSVGGRLAQVLYYGAAAGLDGAQQINVRIPEKCEVGEQVSLWLMDLGRPSNVVKIGIK